MKKTDLDCIYNLAKAWNNLSINPIKEEVADDVIYVSQWVLIPIEGKNRVLRYLEQKFNSIQLAKSLGLMGITAEMATHADLPGKHCIILTQITENEIRQVLVYAQVKGLKINAIDICFLPSPEEAILSENIPF